MPPFQPRLLQICDTPLPEGCADWLSPGWLQPLPEPSLRLSRLEDALRLAKRQELGFLYGIARLSQESQAMRDILPFLERLRLAGRRLTSALEQLLLGAIDPEDVPALLPFLERAWATSRTLRAHILKHLPPHLLLIVVQGESDASRNPHAVDGYLRQRSHARADALDPYEQLQLIPLEPPGLTARPTADSRLRHRRKLRDEQDSHTFMPDQDLACWLEDLPRPWLEGILFQLSLPYVDDRWEIERRIRSTLLDHTALGKVMNHLLPLDKLILRRVLEAGGTLRYDTLLHRHGADDAEAWHWHEEVPTTPLERVRRFGLLFVGTTRVSGQMLKTAVVPVDLRLLLERALMEPADR